MDRREALQTIGGGALLASIAPFTFLSNTAEANTDMALSIAPPPRATSLSLPNVILRNQDNQKVRLYDDLIKDKVFIINMFFIGCTDGKCPVVTANLARVQKLIGDRLGRDVFMYSISLAPKHDTPKALKKYAAHFGVKPGWSFLTGDANDIERLRRKLGFWSPDPVRDAKKTTHTGLVMMGNDRLDRWMGTPALAKPTAIMRNFSYVDEPQNQNFS